MKTVEVFYLPASPYCAKAREAVEELKAEDENYARVPIKWIDESEEADYANEHDYSDVPAVYYNNRMVFEAHPGVSTEKIKAGIKAALDKALFEGPAEGIVHTEHEPRRPEGEKKTKTAVVFLADGFEECEGLIVVDLLRRAGVEVITASVTGKREITSSHQVKLIADALAEEVDFQAADMVILPGGMPGTTALGESRIVREQCLNFAREKHVAAICAAPGVLADLGLLEGKAATCHPSVEWKLESACVTREPVSVAGNIVTGRALGAAIPFALKLVEVLVDREAADRISALICV